MMAFMRGWKKVLLWAVILLACAGVGAGVAYLFPEWGIRDAPHSDPGVLPSPTPSPSASTGDLVRWSVSMTSRTKHTYHVGGSCTSDWRVRGEIELTDSGRVDGHGVAKLLPGARCDFPSAQVQARRIDVSILGRRDGDELDLHFSEIGRLPLGSQDLGGFVKTLSRLRFSIPERAGADATKPKRIEDPDGEIYASVTRIRIGR
jgi:hypothetical protein